MTISSARPDQWVVGVFGDYEFADINGDLTDQRPSSAAPQAA